MSKSLARVIQALRAAGVDATPVETTGEARTAEAAAMEANCALDQIVKSILFQGESGQLYLFLTAGGNRVDASLAQSLAGEPLSRADGNRVRQVTGFAIGGVAPIGHLTPLPTFLDPRLQDFSVVWAAAGTPRHIFATDPATLVQITAARIASFTA